MVAKRIIPCLDVKDGRTVKGVNFVGLQDVGDAVELGAEYARQGADELVYLDISATVEGRGTFVNLVQRISERINIPFTVGGGISSLDDAARLLDAGADKMSINSAAVRNPSLIDEIASKYGSQFVVLAVDAKSVGDQWFITTHGGRKMTDVWVDRYIDTYINRYIGTCSDRQQTEKIYADIFSCAPFNYSEMDVEFSSLGKVISNELVVRGSKHIDKVKSIKEEDLTEVYTYWQRVINKR